MVNLFRINVLCQGKMIGVLINHVSGIIILIIQEILSQNPELCFQQDNAKGHSAAFTKEVLEAIGITPIFWPANSPDLNPIKTVWDLMRDWIQKKLPRSP
jgi:hypothetical protein